MQKKKVGVVQVVSSLLVNLRLWLLELVCGQIDFPEKTSTKSSKIVITSLRHFYSISQKETQGNSLSVLLFMIMLMSLNIEKL